MKAEGGNKKKKITFRLTGAAVHSFQIEFSGSNYIFMHILIIRIRSFPTFLNRNVTFLLSYAD